MTKIDYFNLKKNLKKIIYGKNVQIIESYFLDVILSLYSEAEKNTDRAYDLGVYNCSKFLVFLNEKNHNMLLSSYYDMHIYAINFVNLIYRLNNKIKQLQKEECHKTLEGSMAE